MKRKSLIGQILLYGIPTLLVVGVLVVAVKNGRSNSTPTDIVPPTQDAANPPDKSTREIAMSCTTDMATQFHIHPWLAIKVDGVAQTIPEDIGITNGCMNPIHTHDATGKIHVESPVQRDFTLGDFFAVWNKPLDAFGTLTGMTVNGTASADGENLVFRDDDKIELDYAAKKAGD
ncbi:hypothetical protein EBS80_01005 [bacterium]|nr:hypothetical protein [bacterium]